MIFPFSFRFAIPGLFNPFAVPQQPPPTTQPATANRDSLRAAALRIQQSPTSRIIAGSQEPYQYPAAPAYPSSSSSSSSIPLPTNNNRRISRSQLPKIPRRYHSPDTTPTTLRALPLSRKRGWEPTFGAESLASSTGSLNSTGKASSTTSLSFTSPEGYLDTPARYREMMEGDMDMRMSDERRFAQDETAAATDSEPPHKKRRGLAGSIVSTAVSAALIGTAVGLTVYRLWRDRGKEGQIANSAHNATDSDSDQPPPPPYDEAVGSRITQHPTVPLSSSSSTSTSTTTTQRVVPTTPGTPTPHTRFGSGTGTGKGRKKHTVTVRRAKRSTPRQGYVSAFGSPRARGSTSAGARGGEFDFGYDYAGREDAGEGRTEVEDKMDWMGDKLSQLIEQGRRALQTEVVVMSEAREDEVDDGAGGWVEDDNDDDEEGVDSDADSMRGYGAGAGGGRRRAGSVRSLRSLRSKATVTPRKTDGLGLGISVPSSSSMAAAAPFYTASFERPPVHGHTRGVSHESGLSFGLSTPGGQGGFGVTEEESGAWESPEIRASMERARARVLAARRGGGGV